MNEIELMLGESEPVSLTILQDKQVDLDLENVGGTSNYNALTNKPSINDVTVQGHKLSADYHLQDKMDVATQAEVEAILYID